ncbi:MAG: hypothetical protein DRJ52_08025 [Thermoprotei archaeon]|nr:MAG: hypothetical protein DRJ52_08025 [Thermoprotei archaeon]RLF00597.1 MAG: hypothetical protein DRJ63_02145 [Thermoprotei archaeon]
MVKVKCRSCGEDVDIDKRDFEVSANIDEFLGKTVLVSIRLTARCPKCGRKAVDEREIIEFAI